MKFVTKSWKILTNPFLLMAEGFIAGSILFWATSPESAEAMDQAKTSAERPASYSPSR